jgi:hypothetical protein
MAGEGAFAHLMDSTILGPLTYGNLNCPDDGTTCFCYDTTGLIMATTGGFGTHQPKPEKLPLFKGGGAWPGYAFYENLKFKGFSSRTSNCGKKAIAISANYKHPDFHPFAEFKNIEFEDTVKEAMFDIPAPPQGWANIADCGEFTCTGLYNVVVRFENTKYTGSPFAFGMPTDFQVTSNNKESTSAQVIPNCDLVDKWNAYLC